MKYFKYTLLIVFLSIVSCDLPSESTVYHWAEHWIATMDANGQNIQYVHRSVNLDYTSDYLIPFEKDNTLKILDCDFRHIMIVNLDGSNALNLVDDAYSSVSRCSVSADGQFIVYSKKGNIYKKATDGTQVIPLVIDTTYNDTDPQFSPKNQEVVFVRIWRNGNKYALMLLSENGDQLIKLTDNLNDPAKAKSISCPTFSNNGQRIYYRYYGSSDASGIYSINIDGSNKRLLYSFTSWNHSIEVSPKGDIAFSISKNLIVMDSLGNRVKNLGQQFVPGSNNYRFKFSPDGNKIILSDGDHYRPTIKVINLQTQEVQNLGTGWSPTFLPDGRILFIAKRWFESKNSGDVPYDLIEY